MTLKLTETPGGIILPVKVVPGSSRTRLAGLLGDALKINIAAAPEKGKANKELVRFLADFFELPKSVISVANGEHNVRKEILIGQIDLQTLKTKLQPHLL